MSADEVVHGQFSFIGETKDGRSVGGNFSSLRSRSGSCSVTEDVVAPPSEGEDEPPPEEFQRGQSFAFTAGFDDEVPQPSGELTMGGVPLDVPAGTGGRGRPDRHMPPESSWGS